MSVSGDILKKVHVPSFLSEYTGVQNYLFLVLCENYDKTRMHHNILVGSARMAEYNQNANLLVLVLYRVLRNTLNILKLNNVFINYFFQKVSSPAENSTDRIYVICQKSMVMQLGDPEPGL